MSLKRLKSNYRRVCSRNQLKTYLKIISYKDFRKFSNNDFRTQILRDFSTLHLSTDSPFLDLYVDICIRTLDIYAPKRISILEPISLKQWWIARS